MNLKIFLLVSWCLTLSRASPQNAEYGDQGRSNSFRRYNAPPPPYGGHHKDHGPFPQGSPQIGERPINEWNPYDMGPPNRGPPPNRGLQRNVGPPPNRGPPQEMGPPGNRRRPPNRGPNEMDLPPNREHPQNFQPEPNQDYQETPDNMYNRFEPNNREPPNSHGSENARPPNGPNRKPQDHDESQRTVNQQNEKLMKQELTFEGSVNEVATSKEPSNVTEGNLLDNRLSNIQTTKQSLVSSSVIVTAPTQAPVVTTQRTTAFPGQADSPVILNQGNLDVSKYMLGPYFQYVPVTPEG